MSKKILWMSAAALVLVLLLFKLSASSKTNAKQVWHPPLWLEQPYESAFLEESRYLKTGQNFDPGYSGFEIIYKNKPIPYELFSFFVLPGEIVEIGLPEELLDLELSVSPFIFLQPNGLTATFANDTGWQVTAPEETGIYAIDFVDGRNGAFKRIQLIVMVPAENIRDGWLNGYRIGRYPAEPLNGNPAYLPPAGFIEVTAANRDTRISPHFTLGQFLCKQEGGFPKYVVLQERLLLQLENILEKSNRRGYRAPTFHIMSGYRTPWYNQAIGNGRYSRHIYGDAADIFIDFRPNNGRMDDLNGDGVVDIRDARILFELVDRIQQNADEAHQMGGLGIYGNRPWRGPFIHVDGRGHNARWELH